MKYELMSIYDIPQYHLKFALMTSCAMKTSGPVDLKTANPLIAIFFSLTALVLLKGQRSWCTSLVCHQLCNIYGRS